MRLAHIALTCALLILTPLAGLAAATTASVRAIAFTASNASGKTDPQLAPYEGILRRNLRFESFHYLGESSASVSAGGTATLSLPNGERVELESSKSGAVNVRRGSTVVTVSRGRPAVFMGRPANGGQAAGIIVMAN